MLHLKVGKVVLCYYTSEKNHYVMFYFNSNKTIL